MAALYTNRAVSTLAAGITNSATSMAVASGQGVLFPVISIADHFYVTLDDNAGNVEIVKVTARSTDTFTIVRGQDGTTAQAFSAGAIVELRLVRALLDDIKADARSGLAPLNGTGASGTWGISITGNAASATQLYITESPDDSVAYPVPYCNPAGNANGNRSLYTDNGGLSFNPGTNVLTCSTFSGSLSGNASSATQLQTGRTINGTTFFGTANIITSYWGSSRTLTIGSTGKSVNGSSNVSWSLSEIGALANVTPGTAGNVLTSNGSAWVSQAPAAGGQYLGTAATKAIAYNSNTIAENITITSGLNGLSAGPITINNGFTVTVESGAVWAIV
jgi:hypothetical protein